MNRRVVRQGIRNLETRKIEGYELMFEESEEDLFNDKDEVAAHTLSEFLASKEEDIDADKKIFITVTPTFLFEDTPSILKKDRFVIQLECNLLNHPDTERLVEQYYEEGYTFAIRDFRFSPKYMSLLEYMDYIRLNVHMVDNERKRYTMKNISDLVHSFNKKIIAVGIENKEDYDFAVELNADYVEGSYVIKALATKVKKTEFLKSNFFDLVTAISKDEPDISEIEAIVSRDAGLTYALLKLVNSAYFALRHRTASIKQALVIMGIPLLKQWIYMLSFSGIEFDTNEDLLKISFMRANFSEIVVKKLPKCGITPQEGYMLGMFSTLPYMVDGEMDDLLKDIPISDELREALVNGGGIPGIILKMVVAYERAEWKQCDVYAKELGIDNKQLLKIYFKCEEKVNEVWEQITNEYLRTDSATIK